MDADNALLKPTISSPSSEIVPCDRREPVNEDSEVLVTELCDARLHQLNIQFWTSVQIENGMAARCISLYLETDHPLLGPFDAELFISHLVSGVVGDSAYCTPLLVNALLYWACVRLSDYVFHLKTWSLTNANNAANIWLYRP